jgi:tetratricopeptide (TPR) repeat protein
MMLSIHLVFALVAFVAQDRAVGQDRALAGIARESFTAAKALYASGDYEEALTRLTNATAEGGAAEVNQYRALCLLALGRVAEAERSLEDLVTQQPLFKMSEADVSPRVVTLFHDVRRRLLPDATRDLYARAKVNYDQKIFDVAASQLKDLLQLLADPDLGAEAGTLGDLKVIAEGFLELAEAKHAAQIKADSEAAAARTAAAEKAATARAAEPPAPLFYTEADKDVTPPVELVKRMPEWRPPNTIAKSGAYTGVLRLIIDEQGKVEQAHLVQKVLDGYDPLLIAAAKEWTFRPARRNGQPVKYQKLIGITLLPR